MDQSIKLEVLSLCTLALFDLVAVLNLLGLQIPFVQPILCFLLTGVFLGGMFLALIGMRPTFEARWFAYALGAGMVLLMLAGLVITAALPAVGYMRPLSPVPVILTLNLLVTGFALQARRADAPTLVAPHSFLSQRDFCPSVLALCSLPFWTVIVITFFNTTNNNIPLIFLLVGIALLPVYVVLYGLNERYHTLALAATGLSIHWHKNLFLVSSFGGHTSIVSIWQSGFWDFGGESLAVNAVLMPALGHLSGVHILTFMSVLFPLLVVFIPVVIFVTLREYVDTRTAFLGAVLFAFSHPFYYQYPDNPRAAMPVLFLVLIGALISDVHNSKFQRYFLAVLFGFGIVASHYGTSYYVMFALIGALVVMRAYELLDTAITQLERLRAKVREWLGEESMTDFGKDRVIVLTHSFVGYYVVTVVAYYYFVDDGTVYELLVDQIFAAYIDLVVGSESGGGATATRLTTDYGGLSVDYSKHLYAVIALMIALGLVVVHWDRFVRCRRTQFDDDYMALGGMLLFLFGGTIVVSGNWGGGRPMMIVFSFTTVYAVIGMMWLARSLKRCTEILLEKVDAKQPLSASEVALAGQGAFAVLLAVFFVLNTGTMAAVAYGGEAPSEIPSTDIEKQYGETDIALHAFATDYRSPSEHVYADRGARQQATDWENGEIDAITERSVYRFPSSQDLEAISNSSNMMRGYMVLVGHNVVDGTVDVNFIIDRPIDQYDLQEDDRHLVYSNGRGKLYYTDETAETLATEEDDA